MIINYINIIIFSELFKNVQNFYVKLIHVYDFNIGCEKNKSYKKILFEFIQNLESFKLFNAYKGSDGFS